MDKDDLEKWQHNIENAMGDMSKKIDQLLSAILGNELTKEGGFNQFFDDHEKRIKGLEQREVESNNFNKKLLVVWMTVCTIAGVLYAVASLYLKFKSN